MTATIVLLPGDGIGPEIMAAAVEVLTRSASSSTTSSSWAARRSTRTAARSPTRCSTPAARSDAVLLAAVGGPKWDTTDPAAPRPEQGLLGLRKGLGLFANLRPVRPSPALLDASPLKRERIEGTDLLVVRELTGGIYFGDSGLDGDTAHDTCTYSEGEIERIARVAFRLARRKVTSVDKANVLETLAALAQGRRAGRPRSEDIPLDHMLVDNAAMQLVSRPADFDVIAHREHVRRHPQRRGGDAHRLDRDAAERARSATAGPGLFEPVHGSAPDIAGTGTANPLAMFGSVAMMLRHGLARKTRPLPVESAVDRALGDGLGPRTSAATPPQRTPPGPSSRTSRSST